MSNETVTAPQNPATSGFPYRQFVLIDNGDGTDTLTTKLSADGSYPSNPTSITPGRGVKVAGTAGGGGGLQLPSVTKTGTYAPTANDYTIRCDATTGAFSINLPPAASVFSNGAGLVLNVKKIDATNNAVTIQGNGAENIDGANTKPVTTQFENISIQSNGTGWDIL